MTMWFRSWHGAPTDPKWILIARKANSTPVVVSAIVWALFDHASQESDRGSVAGFDQETYAAWAGIDDDEVARVVKALTDKGLIVEGRLAAEKLVTFPNHYERPLAYEWNRLRSFVFERDDYTCQYCGDRGTRLECDHVVPVSRGGSHEPDNLVTACFTCNRSKRDRTPEEWLA